MFNLSSKSKNYGAKKSKHSKPIRGKSDTGMVKTGVTRVGYVFTPTHCYSYQHQPVSQPILFQSIQDFSFSV